MTIYVPVGKIITDSYDLNTSQFSLSGTTLSITPGGIYVFASDAEAITGTSTTLIMNPANTAAKVANAIASYAPITTTPVILDSAVASTTVGNTAVETTLYTFSIPANTLGTANALRLVIIGSMLQNASKYLQVKLKYGATTVADAVTLSYFDSATTFSIKIEAFLVAQGATNSQFGTAYYKEGVINLGGVGIHGTAAEDSTGALDLVITAKWSAASASATLTSKYVILEKIVGV